MIAEQLYLCACLLAVSAAIVGLAIIIEIYSGDENDEQD